MDESERTRKEAFEPLLENTGTLGADMRKAAAQNLRAGEESTSPRSYPGVVPQRTVRLKGRGTSATLGGYQLSLTEAGFLRVWTGLRLAGEYAVHDLPGPEWFGLADKQGTPLPLAVQVRREPTGRASLEEMTMAMIEIGLHGVEAENAYYVQGAAAPFGGIETLGPWAGSPG